MRFTQMMKSKPLPNPVLKEVNEPKEGKMDTLANEIKEGEMSTKKQKQNVAILLSKKKQI